MQDEQPLKPANILNIVATNQGKLPMTKHYPKAAPLTAAQVKALQAQGHIVIDARDSADFGAGFIPGAINVQLSSGEFEQRIGWMTPDDAQLILVTDKDEQAQEAIYKMAFIALDTRVAGFLEGGVAAWTDAGYALDSVAQIDVAALRHRLTVNGLQVLDVRDQEEWDDFHIESAHLTPYTRLVPQITAPSLLDELPWEKEQSIAVTCATGKRSSTAISVMRRAGFTNLYNVTGGMEAWRAANYPTIDSQGYRSGE